MPLADFWCLWWGFRGPRQIFPDPWRDFADPWRIFSERGGFSQTSADFRGLDHATGGNGCRESPQPFLCWISPLLGGKGSRESPQPFLCWISPSWGEKAAETAIVESPRRHGSARPRRPESWRWPRLPPPATSTSCSSPRSHGSGCPATCPSPGSAVYELNGALQVMPVRSRAFKVGGALHGQSE